MAVKKRRKPRRNLKNKKLVITELLKLRLNDCYEKAPRSALILSELDKLVDEIIKCYDN